MFSWLAWALLTTSVVCFDDPDLKAFMEEEDFGLGQSSEEIRNVHWLADRGQSLRIPEVTYEDLNIFCHKGKSRH